MNAVCMFVSGTDACRAEDEDVFFLSFRKGHQGSKGLEAVRRKPVLSTPNLQELKKKTKTTSLQPLVSHLKGDEAAVTPLCLTSSYLKAQGFTVIHV